MAVDMRYGRSLGAQRDGGVTRFAVYATHARECFVRLYRPDLEIDSIHAMEAQGDGRFEIALPGVGHGTLYKFVLDENELPDPYARFLPYGVHGPAMVFDSCYEFRHPPPPSRGLSGQVLYELHVGTFTEQGTYAAASARLQDLKELGVTTLELMPVHAFAGERGWGYDGVAHYAPFAPYGSPDELRAFVDEAHGYGLYVLLDVVYNHFGPAGNYLGAYSADYFTSEVTNAWGQAPNFAHPAMRAWVLDNVRYWLDEFRFDGLRLDAVHALVDPSPKHVLREIVEDIRAFAPTKILIAEDERNDPATVTDVGVDALWADDFHHQVRVTLTGERDGYYADYEPGVAGIARAIEQGWLFQGQVSPSSGKRRGRSAPHLAASAFVYCIQNHDQIGNRALGDRLNSKVAIDAYCMVSSLLLFLPMTPLLFMGQEWAASSPFLYFTDHEPGLGEQVSHGRREEFKRFSAFSDAKARSQIPDPQQLDTFTRSKLVWKEREHEPHASVLTLYRALLALRRSDPVLRDGARDTLCAKAIDRVLLVRRWKGEEQRVCLANFGAEAVPLSKLEIPAQARVVFAQSGELRDRTLRSSQAVILAYSSSLGSA